MLCQSRSWWKLDLHSIALLVNPAFGGHFSSTGWNCYLGMPEAEVPAKCEMYGRVRASKSDATVAGLYVGQDPWSNKQTIVAANDLPSTYSFGYAGVSTFTDTYDGKSNLLLLPSSPAEQACQSLGVTWYLPAIAQLTALWPNRARINMANGMLYYWSSTSVSSANARLMYNGDGSVQNWSKAAPWSVRCFSTFS